MKLLFLLSLCFAVTMAVVIKMPIQKKMPDARLLKLFSKFKTGSENFSDYLDNLYYGNVTLGTPSQWFQVNLDTGSTHFWVVDESCTSSQCNGRFSHFMNSTWKKHKYRREDSSTFRNDGTYFEVHYGSGSAEGEDAIDTLNIGGLTVEKQTFGAAYEISSNFGSQPIDGILGLGWPDEQQPTPPFQNMIPQLDKPLFSVWLDRHIKPSVGQSGGLITYGAIDQENCGPVITYVPITKQHYWQFTIDSFSISKYINARSKQVISDTGTSYMHGPSKDVDQIIRYSNAEFDESGMYTVDCDAAKDLPDLVFKINNIYFRVPGIEHVIDVELNNGKCALGVKAADGKSHDWNLADSFIRTYCNFHDFGAAQIGFAKAYHTEV